MFFFENDFILNILKLFFSPFHRQHLMFFLPIEWLSHYHKIYSAGILNPYPFPRLILFPLIHTRML